ncbi:MAG: 3'-5' exonuclease [Lachnospiraceae bacterium]|nr:3'-5' exonuclease [Lachnospiraceae bacterium]
MIEDYICLDLETTGLNPKTDKIIEIGAVKVRNGNIVESFQSFVAPERKLEKRIVELTGITDEMLKNAPPKEEIIPCFLEFAGDDILLGHSVLFDFSFIKRTAVNCKLTFERQGIDTLKIARKFLPELESRSLGFLCSHYQIEHKAHRAMADAKATVNLYKKLCEEFYNEEDFKPTPLLYKVKRETPITKPQKERLYRLLELHKLSIEQDGDLSPILSMEVDKLTRSEASRYMDRILAKCGR